MARILRSSGTGSLLPWWTWSSTSGNAIKKEFMIRRQRSDFHRAAAPAPDVNDLFEVARVTCRDSRGDLLERDPCCDLPDVPGPGHHSVRCRRRGEYQVRQAAGLPARRRHPRLVDLS